MSEHVHVEVDRTVCIGSANCEYLAPTAFRVDEEGRAEVLSTSVDIAELRAAERECPSGAIHVTADGSSP